MRNLLLTLLIACGALHASSTAVSSCTDGKTTVSPCSTDPNLITGGISGSGYTVNAYAGVSAFATNSSILPPTFPDIPDGQELQAIAETVTVFDPGPTSSVPTAASAQAGEMAKQGEKSSTTYYVMLSYSPDKTEWAGIGRIDSGDAMFDKMGVRCTETGGETGKCTLSNDLGDEIFATFEPGRFHYSGGTGDYAGISGEGEYTCEHPASPDSATAFEICAQESSWKLP